MDAFLQKINTGYKFRFFLLTKLPAAYFSGLRLVMATKQTSLVTIPFKFLTKNPFKSIYFASQSMAAEMASGILSMVHVKASKKKVSMLVTHFEAEFYKKATDTTSFTCNNGLAIQQAIQNTISTGQGSQCVCISTGTNKNGELVSKFTITWSYKAKG